MLKSRDPVPFPRPLCQNPAVNRCNRNPILSRVDIPDVPPHVVDVSSVFNPGAVRLDDRYLLLLRVQTRGRETYFMLAESADGESFRVQPRLLPIAGLEDIDERIYHVYDARLTAIDDAVYLVFAADTDHGCQLGVARTRDFERIEFVGLARGVDSRNGVLFPEKRQGQYLRLERPNRPLVAGAVTSGDTIVLSASHDLETWSTVGDVMKGRPRSWDELIGSGPPPIKTREGWLHVYHGIATHFAGSNLYQAGVVLLDLDDPSKVLARSRDNILEPREMYELVGQVPNVVFPTGMIVESTDAGGYAVDDSLVRVYYGAADTVVGLATTTVRRLIEACGRA